VGKGLLKMPMAMQAGLYGSAAMMQDEACLSEKSDKQASSCIDRNYL